MRPEVFNSLAKDHKPLSTGTSFSIHSTLDPRTALVAQTVKHLSAMQETRLPSLGQEDYLEKEMATHSSTLTRKMPGWRSLLG